MTYRLKTWLYALCWLFIGWPSLATAADRNIIFFITDDQSPTLGCYGDKQALSPAIDAVAADGVVFRNAFATTASCSASRSVVLSGLHNHRNGQFGHEHHYHKFTTFEDVGRLSMPNVMAAAGYRTAQIGKYHVGPERVYHFQTYLQGNARNPVDMANNCREFIQADDERPFLLYFGTSDPHRGSQDDQSSPSALKPNLFGNKPSRGSFPGVQEQFFESAKIKVPPFLPDSTESREELAQYYQACSRVDAGVARLVQILKESNLYDKTLIVFTSDHGMAFAGAKTTVYEPGLRVPLVVRDPYQANRGFASEALVCHADLTPTFLDYAGGLDDRGDRPKTYGQVATPASQPGAPQLNRNGGEAFDSYHGRSWLKCLADPKQEHSQLLFASHTFHEIQMYYPMRVVRDKNYKLIWNIAHPLPYPFARDLWQASSWQAQQKQGQQANYGVRTVGQYVQRPKFELYNVANDPWESTNLADKSEHAGMLHQYKQRLKQLQKDLGDPWIMKWDYE
jgi:N-sulfoglucosamine sulfohydrolase